MKIRLAVLIVILLAGCQKEKITISESASDVFYVENAGASMRVQVSGNTASNIYILIIHGGPGVSSYVYRTNYISQNLENKCAMVYWDQRNAGASQGNNNGPNLNLNQMVDDLYKVIQVLKFRYGQNISLFLLGHSFGGLLAADFITRPEYQSMVKGYINVDGSHNYPLNDTLTRQMLINEGEYQVSQKINVVNWDPILSYCNTHTGKFVFEESQQLEDYATAAETYIDSVKQINMVTLILKYSISNDYPLTAMLLNLLYSEDSNFNKELAVTQFSSSLNKVNIPVLLIWGKYDFICPLALGVDFFNRINSTEKRMVISPQSGHDLMFQDESLFCNEVNAFVQKYR
jgi:pimeloyl-ACP methyl ester carboxylesterase